MGNFKSLVSYKQQIKNIIFSQQSLMKLLYYASPNALNQNEIEDPYLLLTDHVLFSPRSFETTTIEQNFLLINFDVYANSRDNSIFFNVNINFDILVHNKLAILYDDSYRMDLIIEYIDDWINSASLQNCGVGRVKFEKLTPTLINKDYISYRLIYSVNNFNQQYNRTESR